MTEMTHPTIAETSAGMIRSPGPEEGETSALEIAVAKVLAYRESQARHVAAYVAQLGGYGVTVTCYCGSLRIPRTGTLMPAGMPHQWPHIVTPDGRYYETAPGD